MSRLFAFLRRLRAPLSHVPVECLDIGDSKTQFDLSGS